MEESKKVGILSHILPPFQSGQAAVIYQLLKDMPVDRYCLISLKNKKLESKGKVGLKKLNGSHYYLNNIRLPYRLAAFNIPFLPFYNINTRVKGLMEIIKNENLGAIIACSGDLYNLPAANIACKNLDIPLGIYMFDDYVYQWKGLNRSLSKALAPGLFNDAMGIIAPNEYLRDEYQKNYEVKADVIHNPCEIYDINEIDKKPSVFNRDNINIVYTGSIYGAHYDAFKNLVDAVKLSEDKNIRIHLYTSTSKEDLKSKGIFGDFMVFHSYVSQEEIPTILRNADILFLPLAFNSGFPEVIKTSAPGKTGEYLASGRPILVHAPSDSFLSSYFTKNKCGVVVDKDDPMLLISAVEDLIKNDELKNEISKNAREAAVRDFSLDMVKSQFADFVDNLLR